MKKCTTCLVAVEMASRESEALLRYTVPVVAQMGGEVVLIHVVRPTGSPYIGPVELYEVLHRALLERARQFLAGLAPIMGGVPHRVIVCTGNPAREIVAAAVQERADLIVIATHGHGVLAHLFMGSTAEDVIRTSPVPVLAIRTSLLTAWEPGVRLTSEIPL